MRTIPVSARAKTVNALLKLARQSDVILESSDGTQFFLSRIKNAQSFHIDYDGDELDEEIKAARKNKQFMKFLDERGQHKAGTGIPMKKIREQLGLGKR